MSPIASSAQYISVLKIKWIASYVLLSHSSTFISQLVTYLTLSLPQPLHVRDVGEPCLTVQQYASYPSKSANVTLILESGTHKLDRFDSQFVSSHIEHFTIASEMAYIILTLDSSLYYYYYYNERARFHFSGISFVGRAGGYHEISIHYAQEISIENCSFQGIGIRLSNIRNITILRSCFSNKNDLREGMHLSSSNSILISECVFSNNTLNSYILYISGNRPSVTVTINATTFINNTAQNNHGIVHLSGT